MIKLADVKVFECVSKLTGKITYQFYGHIGQTTTPVPANTDLNLQVLLFSTPFDRTQHLVHLSDTVEVSVAHVDEDTYGAIIYNSHKKGRLMKTDFREKTE